MAGDFKDDFIINLLLSFTVKESISKIDQNLGKLLLAPILIHSRQFSGFAAPCIIITPHRYTYHKIQHSATYIVAWSVCLPVCVMVTIVSPAKTAEWIEMVFGV